MKLGVPGEGVGAGAGVPRRDMHESGLLDKLLYRDGVTIRW